MVFKKGQGGVKKHRPITKIKVLSAEQSWLQQPEETPEAFEAFYKYLQWSGDIKGLAKSLKKNWSLLYRWRDKWQWEARKRAYLNQHLIKEEAAKSSAIRKRAAEWANRRIDTREKGFEVGEKLVARAKKLLSVPVAEKVVTEYATLADGTILTHPETGEPIEITITYNFKENPREARLYADTGLKLMRLSSDMSTENIANLNGEGAENIDLDNMTTEELEAHAEELRRIKQQKLKAGEQI